MRKALSGIALAILSLAFLVFTGGSSNAATATATVASLDIGHIGYNARGADSWWNRNKEFIDIKNVSAGDVNLNGLVVTDNWAHGKTDPECNIFKVTADYILPAGKIYRVYVGSGVNRVDGDVHKVYMNSKHGCGYKGHFLNNLGDTVWISYGGASEARVYDFENGYYI